MENNNEAEIQSEHRLQVDYCKNGREKKCRDKRENRLVCSSFLHKERKEKEKEKKLEIKEK